MISLECKKIENLPVSAKDFLRKTKGNKKFAFYGKMGAGKTTFIKAICNELGAKETVNSPSFTLINEYQAKSGELIFHFDLYRIKEIEELYDIGYEDYFYSNSYLFIEWPELAEDLLPGDICRVYLQEKENGNRIISFTGDK